MTMKEEPLRYLAHHHGDWKVVLERDVIPGPWHGKLISPDGSETPLTTEQTKAYGLTTTTTQRDAWIHETLTNQKP